MKLIYAAFLFALNFIGMTQTNSINITETTLKVAAMSEEIFYYGFAEGDQLIFSFHDLNNKKLKEVEIIEYPANSRFMDYKTKNIESKTITVLRTGVYAFRLRNGALFKRICKIKIDRIPATDKTKQFNTAVKWVERPDTIWNVYTRPVVVGYDTLLTYKTRTELVKSEISEDLFMVKDERVHSQTNSNGNKTSIFFTVPSYASTETIHKNVVALAYWVGVGKEANIQWNKNTANLKNLIKSTTAFFTTPLGALAVGAIADLALPAQGIGEDVYYALVNEQNKNLFYAGLQFKAYDRGKGTAGFNKFRNPLLLKGTWYIVLSNDNYTLGIDVNIKASAMVQTDYYEEKPYTEQKITTRYEKKIYKEPLISFKKVPIIIN